MLIRTQDNSLLVETEEIQICQDTDQVAVFAFSEEDSFLLDEKARIATYKTMKEVSEELDRMTEFFNIYPEGIYKMGLSI